MSIVDVSCDDKMVVVVVGTGNDDADGGNCVDGNLRVDGGGDGSGIAIVLAVLI